MPGARIEAEAGRNAARRRLHDTRTVSGGADMRPLAFIVKQNRCFVIALKRHRDNNRSGDNLSLIPLRRDGAVGAGFRFSGATSEVVTDLIRAPNLDKIRRFSEPHRNEFSRWHGDDEARRAVYNNRTRLLSRVARQALKLRAELEGQRIKPVPPLSAGC
jgi:hypothetical protein